MNAATASRKLSDIGLSVTVDVDGVPSVHWRHPSGVSLSVAFTARHFHEIPIPDLGHVIEARMVALGQAEIKLDGELLPAIDRHQSNALADLKVPE